MKPTETKERFIELRGAGYSLRKCAGELGISTSTAAGWEKTLAADIEDATRQERQALLDTFKATQQARIRRIGTVLDKLEAAIERADFEAVPLPRLLAMYLKYLEAISAFGGNEKPVSDLERMQFSLANLPSGGLLDDEDYDDEDEDCDDEDEDEDDEDEEDENEDEEDENDEDDE